MPSTTEEKRAAGKSVGGRPSIYSEELGARICAVVSVTPKGIRGILKMHDWMPAADTIWEWRMKHSWFAEQYEIAKAKQVNAFVEDTFDLLEETEENTNALKKTEIGINLRKWYAGKLAPKIFGEKSSIELEAKNKTEVTVDELASHAKEY